MDVYTNIFATLTLGVKLRVTQFWTFDFHSLENCWSVLCRGAVGYQFFLLGTVRSERIKERVTDTWHIPKCRLVKRTSSRSWTTSMAFFLSWLPHRRWICQHLWITVTESLSTCWENMWKLLPLDRHYRLINEVNTFVSVVGSWLLTKLIR